MVESPIDPTGPSLPQNTEPDPPTNCPKLSPEWRMASPHTPTTLAYPPRPTAPTLKHIGSGLRRRLPLRHVSRAVGRKRRQSALYPR